MTLELSLRRKAAKARMFAILWLSLAVGILVGTYISLPSAAGRTINAINTITENSTAPDSVNSSEGANSDKKPYISLPVFALTTLILGVFAISFACYLLGKVAFIEIESAERLRGIADALCIAGNNFEQLEKATDLLVPKNQSIASNSKSLSTDDLKGLAEITRVRL